jgi:hypothetical protein
MRELILFSAILLAGCAQVRVIGPYKASLSRTDVESIVQIAQTVEPGQYSRLILQAVARDEVWVDAVVHGGSTFYDYSAVRRGGTSRRGRYTSPPID